MTLRTILLSTLLLCVTTAFADDDTPVPAEVQSLAEAFINAFKTGDAPALTACWHTPEALAEMKRVEAEAVAGISIKEVNPGKEAEKERKRQANNMIASEQRAAYEAAGGSPLGVARQLAELTVSGV